MLDFISDLGYSVHLYTKSGIQMVINKPIT